MKKDTYIHIQGDPEFLPDQIIRVTTADRAIIMGLSVVKYIKKRKIIE